jgi:phage portal protein BeeE
MSSLANFISEANERRLGFHKAASATLNRSGGGSLVGPYASAVPAASPLMSREQFDATKQYAAGMRDVPYTAIRPIAVKIAELPVRCGRKAMRTGEVKPPAGGGRFRAKAFQLSPPFVRKAIAEGLQQDEAHPLLDVFENPNPFLTGWANMYLTALSIQITGRSFWLIDPPADGRPMQLWYLPSNWVTPVHEGGSQPFRGWRILPPGAPSDAAVTVPFERMCYFAFPDPSDPLQTFSPLQSQARAVNTDAEIQKTQFATVSNEGRPGMVIQAGRLPTPPGQTGQGERIMFTPEQRQQLVQACRAAYSGAVHRGEPIILDALIEGVSPYTLTPAELDFTGGAKLTKDRIMQGIGTNPIVAGQIESANRASAYVAHEGFYDLVVNPMGTMMSQVMTERVGPYFEATDLEGRRVGGSKLYIWLEKAKAHDADLTIATAETLMAGEAITKDELREMFDMQPMAEGGDEIAAPAKPEPAGPAGTTNPTRPKQPRAA